MWSSWDLKRSFSWRELLSNFTMLLVELCCKPVIASLVLWTLFSKQKRKKSYVTMIRWIFFYKCKCLVKETCQLMSLWGRSITINESVKWLESWTICSSLTHLNCAILFCQSGQTSCLLLLPHQGSVFRFSYGLFKPLSSSKHPTQELCSDGLFVVA